MDRKQRTEQPGSLGNCRNALTGVRSIGRVCERRRWQSRHERKRTNMPTVEVTLPNEIVLGRNGSIGTLSVAWDKEPSHLLDHIASVYFPQYLTDAANAGGRDKSPAERLARAEKKLETMYAGQVRTRGAAAEPTDLVDLEAFRMAKAALVAFAKTKPEWNSIPKGERKSPNA